MIDDYLAVVLEEYKKTAKKVKIRIKWNIAYIVLCTINLILDINIIVTHIDKWGYNLAYSVFIIIWCLAIYFTLKTIKKQRIEVSESINDYYELLKTLDYSSYIKEMRTKKLKKIQKFK